MEKLNGVDTRVAELFNGVSSTKISAYQLNELAYYANELAIHGAQEGEFYNGNKNFDPSSVRDGYNVENNIVVLIDNKGEYVSFSQYATH